jgi:hypothetical protein
VLLIDTEVQGSKQLGELVGRVGVVEQAGGDRKCDLPISRGRLVGLSSADPAAEVDEA